MEPNEKNENRRPWIVKLCVALAIAAVFITLLATASCRMQKYKGPVVAVNGDFAGVAKNSFRIENGKIGPALSETMISGNLADMLKNIGGISAELVCSGSYALPWVVFRNVVISGS